MINFSNYPQQLWYDFINTSMTNPITLKNVNDFNSAFIYDRMFGLFYVDFGHHNIAAAFLLAMHENLGSIAEVYSKHINHFMDILIEKYPGIAFKSGASIYNRVYTWNKKSLNQFELDYFGKVEYISNT